MQSRLNFVVDPDLTAVRGLVESRVDEMSAEVDAATLRQVLDEPTIGVLSLGLQATGASEGTLWIADREEEFLVAAFNNGPQSEKFVGKFRQSLGAGIISMVYASSNPYCENEVYHSRDQDGTLDGNLGVLTCAMIAVPLYFGAAVRGVISAVKLKPADSDEPDPPGFTGLDAQDLGDLSIVTGRLIDHRLAKICLGLDDV